MSAATQCTLPLDPTVTAAQLLEVRGPSGAQRYALAICNELGIDPPKQVDIDVVIRLANVASLVSRLDEFDDAGPILREIECAVAGAMRALLGDVS